METNQDKQAAPGVSAGAEPAHAHEMESPSKAVPVSPLIARSQAAYYRDLPELLRNHYWDWVAYHGEERIGFARCEMDLYQECLYRGLKPDEFVVLSVEPQALHDHEEMEPPCV